MPFTFLAHQAAIAPLKLMRPAWFSGTALAVGSMAPDFVYFLRGDTIGHFGHTPLGLVVFCLPLSIALTWLVQRVLVAPVTRHLPDCGPFHLRDLVIIDDKERQGARRWWLLVSTSALVGALSHVAWDSFTHNNAWGVERLPILRTAVNVPWFGRQPVWHVLQHGGSVVGAAITVTVLYVIGSRHLLRTWSSVEPPPVAPATFASHLRLWLPFAVGVLAGLMWAAVAPPGGEHELRRTVITAFLRATSLGFGGLVVGAILVRITSWRSTARATPGA
jgi:hypothetical protein